MISVLYPCKMDLFRILFGFYLFFSFASCSLSTDLFQHKDQSSYYLKPHESTLQALIITFFRIPLLRSMIFETADSINDPSSREFFNKILSGIIASMREIEATSETNENGDLIIRNYDVRKFFYCEAFVGKSEIEIFSILVSSLSPKIQEFFIYNLNNGHVGSVIDLSLPEIAGDNILDSFKKNRLTITRFPKILTFHLRRKSPSNSVDTTEYLVPPNLRFNRNNYILVAKMGLTSKNDRIITVSRTKLHPSGNMITTLHDQGFGNYNMCTNDFFRTADNDSVILMYVAIDQVGRLSTSLNDEAVSLKGTSVPGEFYKSILEIEDLMNFFMPLKEITPDIENLFQKNIIFGNTIRSVMKIKSLVSFELTRSFLFFSSFHVHLKGGLNYSFIPSANGIPFSPLELALSVLESDDGVVMKIFKAHSDSETSNLTKELGLVLFKMRIGLRRITLNNLALKFATIMKKNVDYLIGDKKYCPMNMRVMEILKIVDNKFMGTPIPNVITYDGLDTDDVLSVENSLITGAIEAWRLIEPRQCVIHGAWVDTTLTEPRTLKKNRVRITFSAPESEMFAVAINRYNPFNNLYSTDKKIFFNGEKVVLHSFIHREASSETFYHLRICPRTGFIFSFTPGTSLKLVRDDLNLYSRLILQNSVIMFFKNSKDSKDDNESAEVEPITIDHVPEEYRNEVIKAFPGLVRESIERLKSKSK